MSSRQSHGVDVRYLEPGDNERWDDFVEAHPEGTFFHRAGWKRVIENSFGHRCYQLYAAHRQEISGVLPLTHIKSRLFGNALISNAFGVYGGPVTLDAKTSEALTIEAQDLAQRLDVDYLEFRTRTPRDLDWPCNAELYATFRGSIEVDPEEALLAVPRKRRAEIRKALSRSLTSDVSLDVPRFYRIYAESVRNLGTPVFGRGYFDNLVSTFAPHCDILTVMHKGTALSSVLSFYFRDEVLPFYGGSVSASRNLPVNDYMYWALMRHAVDRGARIFDFGRSKRGTGAFAYKKNWGFGPERLHHQYCLLKRTTMPTMNPLNPKFRPLIKLWQHLPLGVANAIGPRIARNLG